MLEPGDVIGGWVLKSRIRDGGYAEVWVCAKADDPAFEAALKILHPQAPGQDPVARPRFEREIRLLSELGGDEGAPIEIPYLLDRGVHRQRIYLVMELVRGRNLHEILETGSRLSMVELLRVALGISRALAYLHGKEIYHRDVSLGNILLTEGGDVRLVDFGIASTAAERALTQAHFVVGTIGFIPPEVLAGEEGHPSHRDRYALGVVLTRMFTRVHADWQPVGLTTIANRLRSTSQADRPEMRTVHDLIERSLPVPASLDAIPPKPPIAPIPGKLVARKQVVFLVDNRPTLGQALGGTGPPKWEVARGALRTVLEQTDKTVFAAIMPMLGKGHGPRSAPALAAAMDPDLLAPRSEQAGERHFSALPRHVGGDAVPTTYCLVTGYEALPPRLEALQSKLTVLYLSERAVESPVRMKMFGASVRRIHSATGLVDALRTVMAA